MSWDILVIASSSPPPEFYEMTADWKGDSLGSLAEIREKISGVFPDVDWRKPTTGHYRGNGFSFEFNAGPEDPTDNLMIHVRGEGDAVAQLLKLGEATGWYMLDAGAEEWLHNSQDPEAGLKDLQAYRDRVIEDADDGDE